MKTRCVYKMEIGPYFYIGSTTKGRFRRNNWIYRLKSGKYLTAKFERFKDKLSCFIPTFHVLVDGENLNNEQLKEEEIKLLLIHAENPMCLNTVKDR